MTSPRAWVPRASNIQPTMARFTSWAAPYVDAMEATLERGIARRLFSLGWRPQVITYPTYGAASELTGGPGWVRVLARVLLTRPRPGSGESEGGRGWRSFLTVAVPDVQVNVVAGGREHTLRSGRGGYLDTVVGSDLGPGVHELGLRTHGSPTKLAAVHVVGPDERFGIISDIDDTVIITALPRPLVAARNAFLHLDTSRRPVLGMASFFRTLLTEHPDALVVYVSTGAWNVAPAMGRFLARHGYPAGPLLMTDWGPAEDRLFRSGAEHKRTALRRLLSELPHISWVLVGDDGQHDPAIYDELVSERPQAIRLVAIRELTAAEQVRTHGTLDPPDEHSPAAEGQQPGDGIPRLRGRDGHELVRNLSHLPSDT
jgi:phosphatidate phosphatase APP1